MAKRGSVAGLALALVASALLASGPRAPAYADEASGETVETVGTVEPDGGPAPQPEEARWSWARIGIGSFDLLVLRPLGAAATVGGAGFFVIAAPLVAGSWGIDAAWDVFVLQPAEYTFVRPLGEL